MATSSSGVDTAWEEFVRDDQSSELASLGAVRQAAVLEDCADQLTILGCIMPENYEGRKDICNLDHQEIRAILETQKELSTQYKDLMEARSESQAKVPIELGKIMDLGRQLEDTSSDLKRSNHLFNMATKQSSLSADNLKKAQLDRQWAQDVISETMEELLTLGTFTNLQHAVDVEKAKKADIHDLIMSEMMGRKKIKSLQKQLNDIRKEKEREMHNRNEMITYLKDQLQEMKAKTEMEYRYVKKDRGLQVAQVQKKCANAENDLHNEIEKLRNQIDQENRVHMDIENFLKQQQAAIEEKLEYWVEKYEKDTEAKQQELNSLKAARAADQAALQETARLCLAYEQAIIEDRKEKEAARRKVEQDALELKSVLKLQAWWRGMMVRRFLGPYKLLKKLFEEEQPIPQKGKKGKGKPGAKKKK
ncbi:dynein regulatory complex protein 9 isoform X1 [Anolis carolinensis]|uniref:Dynein regulatory complex protein 9 n=2 Tax=Anolis carolinensis TaxID=28377 RepID=H9GSS4_ANOCA|nr:PREDICTED: IQ domain-containing protein G [Anolis carolinensis]|eukprot:XP_003227015.1 PREDICTED: IQ domain-containing protein G [Anolis carolinensis]